MLLSVLHAGLIGMLLGLTPHVHPLVPERPSIRVRTSRISACRRARLLPRAPVYGAIVGAGYGHVSAERQWRRPAGLTEAAAVLELLP